MGDKTNIPGNTFRRLLRALGVVVLMTAFTGGAIGLQHLQLKKIQSFRPYEDSLFLPRKEYAKTLAFGFDTFLADFLYLRSIQAFGGQWRSAVKDYASIANYFETIVELDPRFIEAYEFGSMVIGENAGDPKRAIALNDLGRIRNPQTYKLCYWNAYISWWVLRDPIGTKFWVKMAEKAPDCPEYVSRLTAYIDKETGQYLAALDRWVQYYLDALPTRDVYMLSIARAQFLDIVEKWNLDILHKTLAKYRQDNEGRLPEDLEELERKGFLTRYNGCDYSKLLALVEGYELTGIVPPGALEQVVKEVAVPMSGVPRSPYGSVKDYRYVIRGDIPPENLDATISDKKLILNLSNARQFTAGRLNFIRAEVERFFLTMKRYPKTLEEVFPNVKFPLDLPAGRWDYNPETGAVDSPSFPEL